VGFLKRLLGGSGQAASDAGGTPSANPTRAELEEDERRYQSELLAGEAARLDDLLRRQERYADRSWVPPAQGTGHSAGERDETEPS
jgi:hypothetical protein